MEDSTAADTLRDLADSPEFVFPVYALVLAPLALYVYHDILDTRWRPVWRLVRYVVAYFVLYVCSAVAIVAYIVIQGVYGNDFKEVGASALALILGTYGAWKLVRLVRIIIAHRSLVRILQSIDCSLARLTGLQPVGMDYHLFRKPALADTGAAARTNWSYETRHDFISSSLFDDDYPGEAAARIKWLRLDGKVRVLADDADECASRVALWMRLVLRRPRSEPWRLLTSSSPLVQGQLYRVSLGEALRALITYGSARVPPGHANPNPAEVLLNPIDHHKESLTEAGVGFFWVASEMGAEEMGQVLAEMPPRWMRGVTQNGKQLMFELVMSLVLCEMPKPPDPALCEILSLPVLKWRRDITNLKVWSMMAEICADAVVSVLPRYTLLGETPPPPVVFDMVRKAVFGLQDATSDKHGFQGDIVGLTLIELIRASYRAGYLAERILGQQLQAELDRSDYTGTLRLYKAEIVTGVFSILTQVGQHAHEDFKKNFAELKKIWGIRLHTEDVFLALRERARKEKEESFNLDQEADSRYWMLGDRDCQCENPAVAFGTVATTASELAPLLLDMLKGYIDEHPRISIEEDPDRYREQWLTWKQSQALDISGSTEHMSVELLRYGSYRSSNASKEMLLPME